jgi:hypothetical protein
MRRKSRKLPREKLTELVLSQVPLPSAFGLEFFGLVLQSSISREEYLTFQSEQRWSLLDTYRFWL